MSGDPLRLMVSQRSSTQSYQASHTLDESDYLFRLLCVARNGIHNLVRAVDGPAAVVGSAERCISHMLQPNRVLKYVEHLQLESASVLRMFLFDAWHEQSTALVHGLADHGSVREAFGRVLAFLRTTTGRCAGQAELFEVVQRLADQHAAETAVTTAAATGTSPEEGNDVMLGWEHERQNVDYTRAMLTIAQDLLRSVLATGGASARRSVSRGSAVGGWGLQTVLSQLPPATVQAIGSHHLALLGRMHDVIVVHVLCGTHVSLEDTLAVVDATAAIAQYTAILQLPIAEQVDLEEWRSLVQGQHDSLSSREEAIFPRLRLVHALERVCVHVLEAGVPSATTTAVTALQRRLRVSHVSNMLQRHTAALQRAEQSARAEAELLRKWIVAATDDRTEDADGVDGDDAEDNEAAAAAYELGHRLHVLDPTSFRHPSVFAKHVRGATLHVDLTLPTPAATILLSLLTLEEERFEPVSIAKLLRRAQEASRAMPLDDVLDWFREGAGGLTDRALEDAEQVIAEAHSADALLSFGFSPDSRLVSLATRHHNASGHEGTTTTEATASTTTDEHSPSPDDPHQQTASSRYLMVGALVALGILGVGVGVFLSLRRPSGGA